MNLSLFRMAILICCISQFEIGQIKGDENSANYTNPTQSDNKISRIKILGEFGPVTIEDIPQCRFRKEIEALNPNSRTVALKKLSELKVPVNNLDSLHVDTNGEIFYSCSGLNVKDLKN